MVSQLLLVCQVKKQFSVSVFKDCGHLEIPKQLIYNCVCKIIVEDFKVKEVLYEATVVMVPVLTAPSKQPLCVILHVKQN